MIWEWGYYCGIVSFGNTSVCKRIYKLSTNINIYKKKNRASSDGCCHNDSLAPEKCDVMRDAKAVWHISVEFITHTKWNQFYSTVTLTFTEKWNGGLEMKTSCEIPTKNFKLVLSLCRHLQKISHVLQTHFYLQQVATYSKQSFLGSWKNWFWTNLIGYKILLSE